MRILPNRKLTKVHDWMAWRWLDIVKNGGTEVYLTRLYRFNTPWFGVKVHWLRRPDQDRDCHDHPWWFLSLVLWGWYRERRQDIQERFLFSDSRKRRGWLSLAFRKATDIHMITEVAPTTITLIITGKKSRSWGFWKERVKYNRHALIQTHQFVPWREYLGVSPDAEGV